MEGQRVAKSKGGGKLPVIAAGAAAGVLAAAYLGICAWAAGQDVILPNVSVAGIDVSSMTVEQARDTVRTAADQAGQDVTLTLAYEDLEKRLNCAGLALDVEQGVEAAQQVGHRNFFTGGPQLVGHMLGMSSQVPLPLAEENFALDDFVSDMEQAVKDATVDHGYQIEGDQLVMTKGAPVTTINWDQTLGSVRESAQEAVEERLSSGEGLVEKTITLSASQSQQQDPDFEAIHQEVYTEAVDASLDLESMEITDHVVGVDFDVKELKRAYQAARSGETFSIPLTITQPKVTKEDLGGQLFKDLLGEGTT
ncbi:MAG: hypothetical protein HFF59_02890, partial [Lawsonibacter sp.]|nr:hypothetical protein [Lawsonibacter sp.]